MDRTSASEKIPAGFCDYDPHDRNYHGAAKVVEAELESIQRRRPNADSSNLTGIALSGGGIRSASFSLGVIQALVRKGWLSRFDYLSTVSGGGYIGSSLTWFLHKKWHYKDDQGQSFCVEFGLEEDTFPFKTEPVWSANITASTTTTGKVPANVRGSILRWLRQNGKYLTPGGCHNFAALTAAVLRGTVLSVFVYLSLLVFIFMGLNSPTVQAFDLVAWDFTLINGGIPKALVFAGWCAALFVFLTLVYSIATFFIGITRAQRTTPTGDNAQTPHPRLVQSIANSYFLRRFAECSLGILLVGILVAALIGLLPLFPAAIGWLFGPALKEEMGTISAVVSVIAGIGSSLGVFAQSNIRKESKWMPVLVGIGAFLLLIGVLLLAYQISVVHFPHPANSVYIWLALTLAIGWFCNLNYISVHRYYRDRLMETFMPDVADAILKDGVPPGASLYADLARIQDMCGGAAGACGPYHLINTNIVLVESNKPKFKGRGGDNFIISPRYCGSNATGWCPTQEFMGGGMTLATAMAISGAAVNPSAGCGGEGVTRKPILSMLMGLLNLRLGYWASNPDRRKRSSLRCYPNFILPGLWELFLRKKLNENSRFIQLSDGGHFENLGLYELLRRRLKLIVVCDGGADPDYTFSDLANVIEKARADFGALVNIEGEILDPLLPRCRKADVDNEGLGKLAERGYLVAQIFYTDNMRGTLIYLTTTFTKNLSADLYGYRKEHQEFPDEPTSDQFFAEKQFEAYRELGFQLTWNMFKKVSDDMDKVMENPSAYFTN